MSLLLLIASAIGIIGISVAYSCGKEVGGGKKFESTYSGFFVYFYFPLVVLTIIGIIITAMNLQEYHELKNKINQSEQNIVEKESI